MPNKKVKIVKNRKNGGFTLTEFMISMMMGALIILGVSSVLSYQMRASNAETNRNLLNSEIHMLFGMVSTLVKQSSASSIIITSSPVSGAGTTVQNDKSTNVALSLIPGFNVWPNNVTPFLASNVVLNWADKKNGNKVGKTIYIENSNFIESVLAGSSESDQIQIVNFDLWPLDISGARQLQATDPALGGYLLTIEGRSSSKESDYINPKYSETNHPLRKFRTYEASGIVFPRNS